LFGARKEVPTMLRHRVVPSMDNLLSQPTSLFDLHFDRGSSGLHGTVIFLLDLFCAFMALVVRLSSHFFEPELFVMRLFTCFFLFLKRFPHCRSSYVENWVCCFVPTFPRFVLLNFSLDVFPLLIHPRLSFWSFLLFVPPSFAASFFPRSHPFASFFRVMFFLQ